MRSLVPSRDRPYEAICALGTDRARRIGAELLARPPGEALWDAILAAVLAHYEGADQAPDAEWLAGLKVVLTGTEPGRDMYPEVLAGAVIAATQVAARRWAAADPPVPLRPLLRQALDQLATACSGAGRLVSGW